jgi:hypothetical protein
MEAHQLDPVISGRVSRRRASDCHHPFGRDTMFAQPPRNP